MLWGSRPREEAALGAVFYWTGLKCYFSLDNAVTFHSDVKV